MNPSEAFDKIWNSMVDVEDYLRVGLSEQLQQSQSFSGDDMHPIHEAFRVFRRVDPYLAPSIRTTVASSFEQLQTGLNAFLDVLRVAIVIPQSEHDNRESARQRAADILNGALLQYKTAMRMVSESRNAALDSQPPRSANIYDAFICHASEDKDSFVKPLAELLIQADYRIWYDEFMLTVGDSLRRTIDRGLAGSRFGVVVLSRAFLQKNWTQYELDGLVAREIEGTKVILPIWHNVTKEEVLKYSPSLADKYALNSVRDSLAAMVNQLSTVFKDA